MTNHIIAMEHIARGILSSAVQFNGVIMFKFKGESQVLAYQDEDGIHVQRRQNKWEVYTPTYKSVYKKTWECWYVQELVNTRNAIVCHRWEAEKHTPIAFGHFLEWCDRHGFDPRVDEQTSTGDMIVSFCKLGDYMGRFVCGTFSPSGNPEVWYWEDDTASNHLTLTSVEELNQH